MTALQIRRFREGDERALFRVRYSAIHEVAIRNYTRDQLDAWAPADLDEALWERQMRDIQPFIAFNDRGIAGYADLQPNGYIDHFFVAGDRQGSGVGTLLMRRIHDEAAQLRVTELTSDVSLTAEGFFARHGFTVIERKQPVVRGVKLRNARMHKRLGEHR